MASCRLIVGRIPGAVVVLLGVAAMLPAVAQTPAPGTATAPQTSGGAAAAGCTYTPTSSVGTGGIGTRAPRHLDEGQTVTNMASRQTYVCHNGKLTRQQ